MPLHVTKVKEFWDQWATDFKTDLRATTKTPTIKQLEIAALTRHVPKNARILEVGCGNGFNVIALAKAVCPKEIVGIDYSAEMIQNARKNLVKATSHLGTLATKVKFEVGNVLELSPKSPFDVVITDRCLINLTDLKLQKQAIDKIASVTKKRGMFLMLENSVQTYRQQNEARKKLGLIPRTPASYNLFLDEKKILPHCKRKFQLVEVENFGSLHDLMLYVLLPSISNGEINYSHPLMEKVTELSLSLQEEHGHPFGTFGQNQLYVLRKR